MTIDIERATAADMDRWDEAVDRSPQGLVFHRSAFLAVLERHASGTLHALVGYKGQQPIGLFPVFVTSKGPYRLAFSPPPRLAVPYLGPVLMTHQPLKQRKLEELNEAFVDGCLGYLDETVGASYTFVDASVEYTDVRPFGWNGFDVAQRYTFSIELSKGADGLLEAFSRSTRRTLTADPDRPFEIRELGLDGIEFVHAAIEARYDAQEKSFGAPLEYVRNLHESLDDGVVRAYVGVVDGEWASGIVTIESPDVVYFFIGGGKPDTGFPVNEHLHWRIMRDAAERGVERYDLIGANQQRIARYKAKFDPVLVPWHQLEAGTPLLTFAADLYKRFR